MREAHSVLESAVTRSTKQGDTEQVLRGWHISACAMVYFVVNTAGDTIGMGYRCAMARTCNATGCLKDI
jgi:hypothetical protein